MSKATTCATRTCIYPVTVYDNCEEKFKHMFITVAELDRRRALIGDVDGIILDQLFYCIGSGSK